MSIYLLSTGLGGFCGIPSTLYPSELLQLSPAAYLLQEFLAGRVETISRRALALSSDPVSWLLSFNLNFRHSTCAAFFLQPLSLMTYFHLMLGILTEETTARRGLTLFRSHDKLSVEALGNDLK